MQEDNSSFLSNDLSCVYGETDKIKLHLPMIIYKVNGEVISMANTNNVVELGIK